jgi:hypothetical protein
LACNLLRIKEEEKNKGSQGLKRMRLKKILKKNFRMIGILGIIASWITIGSVWSGFGTMAFIGYFVTGGLFGLSIVAERI